MIIGPVLFGAAALGLNWTITFFDTVTGVRLIREGKFASFLQVTRSKNIFNLGLLMISGRTLSDCVFIAFISFFLPVYVNSAGIQSIDIYLSIGVLLETYFTNWFIEQANRIPFITWVVAAIVRVWLFWTVNEEIFNRTIESTR